MQKIIKYIGLATLMVFVSCEGIVDDINDNPNEVVIDEVEPQLFLTGAMLANSVAQAGHLNRISGLWSGQLIGFTSLYSNIYGYSISTAESVSTWSRIYIGLISNVRYIRTVATDDPLLTGISKILEAHGIGSIAGLCGDVPYSEINDSDVDDPIFDSQMTVLNSVISLLDGAIADLGGATSRSLSEDIYFDGDADKWREAAYTLKARYMLMMRDYSGAYTAASSGISSADGSMKYTPRGDASISEGDKNLFWTILEGSRTGDIGTGDSHMMQMLDASSGVYRGNAKTDETARFGYYRIDQSGGSVNDGIIEQFEPHNLVTYQENLSILAEAGTRSVDFTTGLGHLNELRQYLNTGDFLNVNYIGQPFLYEDYVAADFAAGGMENMDNIDDTRALLREIIEERYLTGFGTFIPFDDARRVRATDADLVVPFPLNTTAATQHPERMPYSDDELNANANAPADDPGIFVKTEVNQ